MTRVDLERFVAMSWWSNRPPREWLLSMPTEQLARMPAIRSRPALVPPVFALVLIAIALIPATAAQQTIGRTADGLPCRSSDGVFSTDYERAPSCNGCHGSRLPRRAYHHHTALHPCCICLYVVCLSPCCVCARRPLARVATPRLTE